MKKILLFVLALMLMVPTLITEAASKGKVLLVASSTNTLTLKDGKVDPTGYFLDELTVPTMRLIKEGYQVVLATPKGDIPSWTRFPTMSLCSMATKPLLTRHWILYNTTPLCSIPSKLRMPSPRGSIIMQPFMSPAVMHR